jgi:NTE family protein
MKKKVTLVLSGGGARGFAHIGVIEELESRGYIINSVAGTSMGSLVGGVYAAGKLEDFKKWAYALDKQDIFKLIDFTFSTDGLVKGNKVFKSIEAIIPDTNIEDLKIRYTATSFDLANNREVVFDKGSLFKAIRASVSIPTVFTPVISGNSVLVDGGVVNNIPVTNAIRSKNDLLIAVNVNAEIPVYKPLLPKPERDKRYEQYLEKISEFRAKFSKGKEKDNKKKMNYFNLINDTIAAMTNQMTIAALKNNPPDILIEISKDSCSIFDFFKIEELVETGRYAAKQILDS